MSVSQPEVPTTPRLAAAPANELSDVMSQNHQEINWFHSIDLRNGLFTAGVKSVEVLEAEFDRLQLTAEILREKGFSILAATMASCRSEPKN